MSSRKLIGVLSWDYLNPKGGMGRSMQWIASALHVNVDVRIGSPNALDDPLLRSTRGSGGHLLFSLLLPFVLGTWVKKKSIQTLLYPVGPGGVFLLFKPKNVRHIAVMYHTYAQQSRVVPGQWWKRMFIPLEKSTLQKSDDILCFCKDTFDVLMQTYHLDPTRVHLLPHAIDTDAWRAQNVSKEAGLCVCVARLEARKGVDVLVQAWAEVEKNMPHARLVIVGDGVLRTRIDRNIASLAHIERHAALSFEKLRSLVQRAEVAVFPAHLEGFGLAAAEAMAAGTAVIASDADGLRSLIAHEETGILVPPGNPEALAQAIIHALHGKDLTQKIAHAGQASISLSCDPALCEQALRSVICTNGA